MDVVGWSLIGTLILALVPVALLPLVLRRLPEPSTVGGEDGPGWAALAGWQTLGQHLGTAVVGTALVLSTLEPARWPLWWPWLSSGLASALLDARTTWIPRQLCWVGWALCPVSLLVAGLVEIPLPALATAAGGALVATALFWLVWRLGRGAIGFGDVRVMPMIGLAAGSLGPGGWWWSLLLGTSLGAAVAVVRRLRHRPGAMAYAPALVGGPALAAVLIRLTG